MKNTKVIKIGASKVINTTLTQGKKAIKLSPSTAKFIKQTLRNYIKTNYEREYRLLQYDYDNFIQYQSWIKNNTPGNDEVDKIKKEIIGFKKKPKFSIILPIYKTPPDLLKECIDSVVNQYYENWEICIVDDNSSDKDLVKICGDYQKLFKEKFKYKNRKANGHISLASNDAVKMSSGEYIVLLDHDDLLWPNALYEIAKEINKSEEYDFYYTDEDMIDINGHHNHPYAKPPFMQALLNGCNYITHMAVIKTEIFDTIGGFRKGVEGAQDWDLFLRISEQTKKIKHVPKMVYSWRMIAESTALKGFDAKPYAYEAQKKSFVDHQKAIGLPIKDAHLYRGFIGWMAIYDLGKETINLDIIIDKYSDNRKIRDMVGQIEKDISPNVIPTYFIVGYSKLRIRASNIIPSNRKFVTLKNIRQYTDKSDQADYVFYSRDLAGIHTVNGWLSYTIGILKYEKYDALATSLRHTNHNCESAGVKLSGKIRKKLLQDYVEGSSKRTDISLLAPREVDAVDPRAFISRREYFEDIIGESEKTDSLRVYYIPFIKCFINDENKDQTSIKKIIKPLDIANDYTAA